jgi:hypothetical protein
MSNPRHKPGCAGWEDCECFPSADQVRLGKIRRLVYRLETDPEGAADALRDVLGPDAPPSLRRSRRRT